MDYNLRNTDVRQWIAQLVKTYSSVSQPFLACDILRKRIIIRGTWRRTHSNLLQSLTPFWKCIFNGILKDALACGTPEYRKRHPRVPRHPIGKHWPNQTLFCQNAKNAYLHHGMNKFCMQLSLYQHVRKNLARILARWVGAKLSRLHCKMWSYRKAIVGFERWFEQKPTSAMCMQDYF